MECSNCKSESPTPMVTTEDAQTLLFTLKDPMIFQERNKVCYFPRETITGMMGQDHMTVAKFKAI